MKHITWENILNDCKELSKRIDSSYILWGMPRGGQMVANILSHQGNFKVIQMSRSDLLDMPKYFNQKIMIVDDIVDTGDTLFDFYQLGYKICTPYYRSILASFRPSIYLNDIKTKDWLIFPWEKKLIKIE